MKRFLLLFTFLLFSNFFSFSQEVAGLSLFIRDSVKKIIVKNENERITGFLPCSVKRKMRFSLLFNNRTSMDSLWFFLYNQRPREGNELRKVLDTSAIIKYELIYTLGPIAPGLSVDTSWPIIYVPDMINIDTNNVKDTSLRNLLSEPNGIYKLNREISNNFGLTFIVEDSSGQVIRGIHYFPLWKIKKAHHNWKKKKRGNPDFKNKRDKLIMRQYKRILVSHRTKKIRTYIPYLKGLTDRNNVEGVYYNLIPGKTYFLTFYYTFYLNPAFYEDWIGVIYTKIINSEYFKQHPNQVFQGQIKSNKVKIVVK